jgi:hypothetical protein
MRPFALAFLTTLVLAASAPVAEAQGSRTAARMDLAKRFNRATAKPKDGEKTLGDRVVKQAGSWVMAAARKAVEVVRVRTAARLIAKIRRQPAAALDPGTMKRLTDLLEPVLGKGKTAKFITDLQKSMFEELVAIFTAAREAGSTPDNGLRFDFRGKRYGWKMFKGKPILVEVGCAVTGTGGGGSGSGGSGGSGGTPTTQPPPPHLLTENGGVVNYNGKTVSDPVVRKALQRLADFVKGTVTVTSGDRDYVPQGGSRTSWHLQKKAADFKVEGQPLETTFNILRANAGAILPEDTFEVIWHGQNTNTGGPHLHLGNRAPGSTQWKIENGGNYQIQ